MNDFNDLDEFNEWFDSLTPEEQQEYVDDMNADYWIELNKSGYDV